MAPVLHQQGEPTSVREFTWLGVATVPACLVVAVLTLWAGGVHLIGGV